MLLKFLFKLSSSWTPVHEEKTGEMVHLRANATAKQCHRP